MEHALYFRLADLLNLDVELSFYDTTSLHFEIDEMDQGHGDDDLEQIKLAQLLRPRGEVWQVTEPSPEAVNHLKCLGLKDPPAIFHLT